MSVASTAMPLGAPATLSSSCDLQLGRFTFVPRNDPHLRRLAEPRHCLLDVFTARGTHLQTFAPVVRPQPSPTRSTSRRGPQSGESHFWSSPLPRKTADFRTDFSLNFGVFFRWAETRSDSGRRGFTQQTKNSKHTDFRVPALQTPPKFNEKTHKTERIGSIRLCSGHAEF